MYSQNDEETHIVKHFDGKPVGKFLDIGAFDGVTFSNTRRLWELGWSGVLVEPSPKSFLDLMHYYLDIPEGQTAELVNVAVAGENGLMTLQASHGAVSTLDQGHYELWKEAAKFQPIVVNTITVADLLVKFPGPFKFVNLDVEGTNFQILQQLPLDEMKCECICVEYGKDEKAVMSHMKDWVLLHKNAENMIFVR